MKCHNCDLTGTATEILEHSRKCKDPRWKEVAELRAAGLDGTAHRLIRKILGVAKPMSAEAKERLREWAEAHPEEIKQKRKAKALLRSAIRRRMKGRAR